MAGARAHRARSLLVIFEVALTAMALIGAGLFVRSFQNARSLHPGFEEHNVLVARFFLSAVRIFAGAGAAIRPHFDGAVGRHARNSGGGLCGLGAALVRIGSVGDGACRRTRRQPAGGEADQPYGGLAGLFPPVAHSAAGRTRLHQSGRPHGAPGHHRQRNLRATLLSEPGPDRRAGSPGRLLWRAALDHRWGGEEQQAEQPGRGAVSVFLRAVPAAIRHRPQQHGVSPDSRRPQRGARHFAPRGVFPGPGRGSLCCHAAHRVYAGLAVSPASGGDPADGVGCVVPAVGGSGAVQRNGLCGDGTASGDRHPHGPGRTAQ